MGVSSAASSLRLCEVVALGIVIIFQHIKIESIILHPLQTSFLGGSSAASPHNKGINRAMHEDTF